MIAEHDLFAVTQDDNVDNEEAEEEQEHIETHHCLTMWCSTLLWAVPVTRGKPMLSVRGSIKQPTRCSEKK